MQRVSKWTGRFFGLLLALTIIFISAQDAEALMLELSAEELSAEADVVIVGSVENTESFWNDERTNIYTSVEVSVVEVVEGALDQEIVEIIAPGGEVDGITETVTNAPVFEVGEETLLFLNEKTQEVSIQGEGVPSYEVSGNFQGKLEVENGTVGEMSLKSLRQDPGMLAELETGESEDRLTVSSANEDLFIDNGHLWPGDHPEIGFKLGEKGERKEQVLAAAESWNDSGADFSFLHEGELSHQNNISYNGINEIVWHDLNRNDVLALAYVWSTGGTIIEADMVFNESFNWSTGAHSAPGRYDVQTVALHEFGHWLGLGDHYENPELVMYFQYTGMKRDLHEGDLAGAEHIYGLADEGSSQSDNPDEEEYEEEEYVVEVSSEPELSGLVSGGGNYRSGEEATVQAKEKNGYVFDLWKENGEMLSEEAVYSFEVDKDRRLTAYYTLEEKRLSRLAGADRYETAVEVSQAGWPEGSDTVFIARGDDFPDSLAGVPLAYSMDAPILLAKPEGFNQETKQELERLEARQALILGGEAAVPEAVENELESFRLSVERISGKDRYETAAKISGELAELKEADFEKAFITTGKDFSDALAVSAYAASNEFPVLLTCSDSLPGATREVIEGMNLDHLVIIGGENMIDKEVAGELKTLVSNLERVEGADRYKRMLQLAENYLPEEASEIFISTGHNFPDALAGGVLAAKRNSGIILVPGEEKNLPDELVDFIINRRFQRNTIFGGPVAVSGEIEGVLEELLE